MPDYLTGITRPPPSGSGVGLGQVYHEFGFIRLAFGLGFEKCSGPQSSNCYGFSYSLVSDSKVTIYERPTGSTGSGTEVWSSSWSSLEYDYISTSNNNKQTNGIWYLGKDQNIQQSDGQHEYSISVSAKDSHGGGNGASIYWIPSPAPPSGPIVVLENKSGHFLSNGDVKLHVNIFTNPCSGDNANATHIMTSVDGGAWANSNTFPHIETISGIGDHTFKVKGCANTLVGQEITYKFSIGTNDWSNVHMTPVKTIRHVGKKGSFVNFFTNNAIPTQPSPSKGFINFDDVFGGGNCYYSNTRILNANTQEIVGETQSAYSFTHPGQYTVASGGSVGGWEWFEVYPNKLVGELALGSSQWWPDSIWVNIVDKTDNTSYGHSFAPPNSPFFTTSSRQYFSGSQEVEIPYTFKDGHSYEIAMYGDHWTGSHTQGLISMGPDSGNWKINNISVNAFKLEPRATSEQTDASNTFINTYFGGELDTNTFVRFSDVCYRPKADALNYFKATRTRDFEVQLLAISYDKLDIWDECTTPLPTVQEQSIASSPNSDGKYEFTRSGLWTNMRVTELIHPIPGQYYKITTSPNSTSYPSYGYLAADTTETVLVNPDSGDTQMRIDIFNSCGGVVTQTFDLLYVGSTGGTGTIGQGQGPSGSQSTISTTSNSGNKPTYHRLIVNSTNQ